MIEWGYYSKRRNIDLVKLITNNDIETYDQLVEFLNKKGVHPPEKGMFQSAYAIAVPPIPPPAVQKPTRRKKTTAAKPKPKQTKKTRTKKTTG